MIIGIDDSGNFESDSKSLYAAIFIRPKKYDKIVKVFTSWEEGLPTSVKEDGEVKGRLLSKDQLVEFSDKVLINNGCGAIKLGVFMIDIDKHNSSSLIGQRQLNLTQIKEGVDEHYRGKGDEYKEITHQYNQMSTWLNAKSIKTLYKIQLLGITIVKSFNLAILISVNKGYDKELGSLTMSIDEGIVGRKSVEMYWRDLLRNQFWNLTSTVEPMIYLTTWRANHPFVKRFDQYPGSTEALSQFNRSEIDKVFNFYDSKDKPEIRIADIVASTYFRFFVQDEKSLEVAVDRMVSQVIIGKPFTLIRMMNERHPSAKNPFEDKIDGLTMDDLKAKYEK